MQTGIYEVKNSVNGKRYIGSAVNFVRRWALHRYTLNRGDHRSVTLQRAWNKYGESSFEFRKLIVCSKANLLMYEQACIDGFAPEYNICKVAGSRLGTKYTDEARARLAILRKAQPRSAKQLEHIANLANKSRGKPSGRSWNAEERDKIAASLRGRKLSPEHRANIKAAMPVGWNHTDEARAKISAALTGKKKPPFSAEWRANISAGGRGRKHSPESIAKMAASKTGKKLSLAHRAAIAEGQRRRREQ